MENKTLENRIDNVMIRFSELIRLLNGNLKCDQTTEDRILDLLIQSHRNEIQAIALIDNAKCIDELDVPDFMK